MTGRDHEAAIAAYLFADPDELRHKDQPARNRSIRRRFPEATAEDVCRGADLAFRLLNAHAITMLGEERAACARAEAATPTTDRRQ